MQDCHFVSRSVILSGTVILSVVPFLGVPNFFENFFLLIIN